jgi:hypothetical protein
LSANVFPFDDITSRNEQALIEGAFGAQALAGRNAMAEQGRAHKGEGSAAFGESPGGAALFIATKIGGAAQTIKQQQPEHI